MDQSLDKFHGGEIFRGVDSRLPYVHPVRHKMNVVSRESGEILGTGTIAEAEELREYLKSEFGGTYDLIETSTVDSSSREMFSGEIRDISPHVAPIPPIVRSHKSHAQISLPIPWDADKFDESKPILPPETKLRKPRRTDRPSRERCYSGISDPTILHDRGFVVIDLRTQERLFSGTQKLCMDYVSARNVAYSRDKLPLDELKIVRYRDYSEYQNKVEAEGFVVRYLGKKILIGLRSDLEKPLRKLLKNNDRSKFVIEKVSSVDLWWVQNRVREVVAK